MSLWVYIVKVSETSVCVELTGFSILLNVFHNYIFFVCFWKEKQILRSSILLYTKLVKRKQWL